MKIDKFIKIRTPMKSNLKRALACGTMTEVYAVPAVRRMNIAAERGFAASSLGAEASLTSLTENDYGWY